MKRMLVLVLAFGTLRVEAQYSGRRGVRYMNEGNVLTVRHSNDWSQYRSDGRCTIRVRIDDEADVELRGDQLRVRVIRGAPGRDESSECSTPLPTSGNIRNFRFRGIDGRGTQRLVQVPASRNYYVAVVNVQDPRGGDEGYTFELAWNWEAPPGGIFPDRPTTLPPPIPPPSGQNPGRTSLPNISTSSVGTGTLDDGTQRYGLVSVNVRIRDNRCQITLVTDRQQQWEMSGNVVPAAPRCVIDASNRGRTSANALIITDGRTVSSLDVGGNINGRNFQGKFQSRVSHQPR